MKSRITGLRAKSKGVPRSTTRKANHTMRGTGSTSKTGITPARRATTGIRAGGTNSAGSGRARSGRRSSR